jgi:hypothetical protein
MTATPRSAAGRRAAVEGPGRVPPGAARATLAQHINEDDLLSNVIHAARIHGWLVHHCRAARTADGWRTPVQGNRGFPDLVLAKPGRLILAELKAQRGRLSAEQVVWRGVLDLVPAVEVYEWRPADWLSGEIQAVLARPAEVAR